MSQPTRVTADESLIYTCLGLIAKIVVNARNYDNEAIACIGSFAYEARVVGRLAALNVPHHHSAATPGAQVSRIAESVQDAISYLVCGVYHGLG